MSNYSRGAGPVQTKMRQLIAAAREEVRSQKSEVGSSIKSSRLRRLLNRAAKPQINFRPSEKQSFFPHTERRRHH
jgi:hypothetical protein